MHAQWLGDPTDPTGGPYAITQFGVTFERGKNSPLDNLSDAQIEKLRNNPYFRVSDERSKAKAVELDPDLEAESLRRHLKRNGVQFHHNTGLPKLRSMAAEHPGPTLATGASTGVSGGPVKPIGDADPYASVPRGDPLDPTEV